MNSRKMSEILAQMSPEAAEKLTVELAGGEIVFREDPYGFDTLAMPQMFEA